MPPPSQFEEPGAPVMDGSGRDAGVHCRGGSIGEQNVKVGQRSGFMHQPQVHPAASAQHRRGGSDSFPSSLSSLSSNFVFFLGGGQLFFQTSFIWWLSLKVGHNYSKQSKQHNEQKAKK